MDDVRKLSTRTVRDKGNSGSLRQESVFRFPLHFALPPKGFSKGTEIVPRQSDRGHHVF